MVNVGNRGMVQSICGLLPPEGLYYRLSDSLRPDAAISAFGVQRPTGTEIPGTSADWFDIFGWVSHQQTGVVKCPILGILDITL